MALSTVIAAYLSSIGFLIFGALLGTIADYRKTRDRKSVARAASIFSVLLVVTVFLFYQLVVAEGVVCG